MTGGTNPEAAFHDFSIAETRRSLCLIEGILAGEIAERIFLGARDTSARVLVRGIVDYENAEAVGSKLSAGGTKEVAALLRWLRIRVEALLRVPSTWEMVSAVAAKLLIQEQLTGDELAAIVNP